MNDLEQPAFDVLPELAMLKRRLIEESGRRFSAVFMTGEEGGPCSVRFTVWPEAVRYAARRIRVLLDGLHAEEAAFEQDRPPRKKIHV